MDVLTGFVLAFGGGLFTVCIGGIMAYIGLRDFETRAIERADAYLVEKVTGLLKLIHDKPEMFAPVANGLVNDLTKIIKVPEFKIGGMVVSGEGLDALMPMVPRKWRGPVAIVRMFMGDKEEKKSEASSHPFG